MDKLIELWENSRFRPFSVRIQLFIPFIGRGRSEPAVRCAMQCTRVQSHCAVLAFVAILLAPLEAQERGLGM